MRKFKFNKNLFIVAGTMAVVGLCIANLVVSASILHELRGDQYQSPFSMKSLDSDLSCPSNEDEFMDKNEEFLNDIQNIVELVKKRNMSGKRKFTNLRINGVPVVPLEGDGEK